MASEAGNDVVTDCSLFQLRFRAYRLSYVFVPTLYISGRGGVTYTSAQQIADWGGLLGPGDSLAIRIVQLFARVGQGAGQISTLTF